LFEVSLTTHWYAFRSKPNKEDFLARQLEAGGLTVFYPRLQVTPVNPRSRKKKPYFPGYLFIHVDLATVNASTLQWMPGAANLVSFGGEPAPVPDILISTLQKRVDELNQPAKNTIRDLKPGDPILIKSGLFSGYEAIFDGSVSGTERARVLMNFLQERQVSVEVQGNQIVRMKRG
jgi:transcriptional antiterminator RfaH